MAGGSGRIDSADGLAPQTLLDWGKHEELCRGEHDCISMVKRERIKALEREVKKLCGTSEILRACDAPSKFGTA